MNFDEFKFTESNFWAAQNARAENEHAIQMRNRKLQELLILVNLAKVLGMDGRLAERVIKLREELQI